MAEEEQQDFSKLSLEERCQHKNWKARVSAYDELAKTFQRIDDDKEWGKYGGWVRKFPTDSNAAAQEKALEVTLLYLENAGLPQAGRIVAEVMNGVVNKCITAAKAKSKELAMNITLMCVEIEKHELVQEELMKGMEHKNPKVVAGCINILTEILRSFGHKVINLKILLKRIPVLIEDRDKTIREETKKLMVELYRWLGPAFKPQLSAVKPLVVQEVEAEVEKFTVKPQQSRYLRSQQARQERVVGEDGGDEVDEDAAATEDASPDIDPYDLLDPVDILSKLPKDFYEKCEAKKWQERKEAMEVLETLVANPKLEGGDYADLVRMLKKIISKDTNVVVVALAGKCTAGLANGLKKKFSPYASSCISTILEKFKEKKASVVTAMREAIDACFAATSLESIQEDTVLALQNKNPTIKLETNAFLARAFAKTSFKTMSDKKLMKPYFTAIIATLNEPDANVREAAAEAFGVAMKHLGERTLTPLTADMEPIKLQKVKEFMEKAVITAPKEKGVKQPPAKGATIVKPKPGVVKGGSKPEAKKAVIVPKKTVAPASTTEYEDEDYERTMSIKSSAGPQRGGGSIKVAGTAATKAAAKKAPPAAPKIIDEPIGSNLPINNLKSQRISDEMRLKILKWNFSVPREEFIDLLKELMTAAGIGPTLMGNMFHSNFKLHLKALDTLQEEFNLNPEGTKCNLDLILKWATLRFFDTNPSVLIRILDYMINVFQVLSDTEYNMADVEAGAFIPYLVGKLGESKENVRASVHEILRRVSNIYSAQRIFSYLIDGLKSKNARQRTDCLDEMSYMIGVHGMPVMNPAPQAALKEIAKQISDRDTNVRNAALNGVVQAFYIVGDKVFKMIGQLADKDQSLLDERIKRAGKSRPLAPTSLPLKPSAAVHGTSRNMSGHHSSNLSDPSSPPPVTGVTSPSRQHHHSNTSAPLPGNILQPQNLNTPATLNSPNDEYTNQMPQFGSEQQQQQYSTARNNVLPDKYQIDFEAIDNMFNDNEPSSHPMELLDTNVDQFLRGEQIALPKRRTSGKVPINPRKQFDLPRIPTQANQSIDLVVTQLADLNLRRAIESCVKLEKMLQEMDTAPIMSGRVDTMLAMISTQYHRLQPTLKMALEDHLNELNKYFRASVSLLTVLFKNDLLPKKASKDGLKDIIYHLLVLIIDDDVEQLPDSVTIIRLINVMVVRIIENTEPNAISCALIRLLKETLDDCDAGVDNARLLELVMKCQWKLLKQHSIWVQNEDYRWDARAIMYEYHFFMQSHPFNSFGKRDGTPLKTIKTIVHALVMQAGTEPVQLVLNEMPDLKNSDHGVYVSKIIQRELLKKTSITGVTSTATLA